MYNSDMSAFPEKILLTAEQQRQLAQLVEKTGRPWDEVLSEALTSYTAAGKHEDAGNDSGTAAYRCHIGLITEDDGTWSALVLNLPGAGSCGTTKEEALTNLQEAVLATIESYAMAGEEIPWDGCPAEDVPSGAESLWITVHG